MVKSILDTYKDKVENVKIYKRSALIQAIESKEILAFPNSSIIRPKVEHKNNNNTIGVEMQEVYVNDVPLVHCGSETKVEVENIFDARDRTLQKLKHDTKMILEPKIIETLILKQGK